MKQPGVYVLDVYRNKCFVSVTSSRDLRLLTDAASALAKQEKTKARVRDHNGVIVFSVHKDGAWQGRTCDELGPEGMVAWSTTPH